MTLATTIMTSMNNTLIPPTIIHYLYYFKLFILQNGLGDFMILEFFKNQNFDFYMSRIVKTRKMMLLTKLEDYTTLWLH
jgi:hypothetical protein